MLELKSLLKSFSIDEIQTVAFGVCFEDKGNIPESYYEVRVDNVIKISMIDMLKETVNKISSRDLSDFELAQKYGSDESLRGDINMDYFSKIKGIYDFKTLEANPRALDNIENLSYYFISFVDSYDRKVLGVKRASQFKIVIGVRNRLIRIIDDTLTSFNQPIFKLDNDFDFLVTTDTVYILHPSGLEYIAELSDKVLSKAEAKATLLQSEMKFIDFSSIASYVITHKRAARLVMAISVRNDLDRINKENLVAMAEQSNIGLVDKNGKIQPADGNEIAFLELLDRRRYLISLIDGEPEIYRALARESINKKQ